MNIQEFKKQLTNAFRIMRKNGLIARKNFSCCSNCGGYELNEMLNSPENKNKIGYAFYHHQSNDDIPKGYVHIGYASKNSSENEDTVIGKIIKDSLLAAGLNVEWNGKPTQKVKAISPK